MMAATRRIVGGRIGVEPRTQRGFQRIPIARRRHDRKPGLTERVIGGARLERTVAAVPPADPVRNAVGAAFQHTPAKRVDFLICGNFRQGVVFEVSATA
ncbi:hypothetical protein [uncultured Algimonas sp.]|uniref:hypothetical protein n=1 Tax=uncultured Algimonas sp. TaxID=1547920 RepID=UPI002639CAAD|nr:hypothetical protein [uncultured Algimonas sp.]